MLAGFALMVPASDAFAVSEVRAAPGMVMFVGDNAPHKLVISDSSVDVTDKQWILSPVPPQLLQSGQDGAGAWDQLGVNFSHVPVDPDDPDGSKEQAELLAVLASVSDLPSIPPVLAAKISQMRRAAQDFASFERQVAEVKRTANLLSLEWESSFHRAGGVTDALRELKIKVLQMEGLINTLEAQANLAKFEIIALQGEIAGMMRSQPAAVTKAVNRALQRVDQLMRRGGQAGFVALNMLEFIGNVALFADGVDSLLSMNADRVVKITDESGDPIHAVWPCRNLGEVRADDGYAANTVSCPAPHFPAAFGVVHGFQRLSGLYIKGGSANDQIATKLTEQHNPFDEIFVEAGSGNDTVTGSYADERLIGGPGSDTIAGRGGNDIIYGDNLWLNNDVDPTNANDHLYGGAGEDVINGDLGDDLVAGGSGDDRGWSWSGASLYGGKGNDVIVGGSGRDDINAGPGRDTVLAKESDFPADPSKPNGPKQTDEVDFVDCGYTADGGEEYATVGPVSDERGQGEYAFECEATPSFVPSPSTLIALYPVNGQWPWFG